MVPLNARTAIFLTAAIVVAADPSFAQRRERRDGDEHGRRAEHAQPRAQVESRQRQERPRGNDDRPRDNRSFGNRPDSGRFQERTQPYRGDDRHRSESRRDEGPRFGDRSDNRSFGSRPDRDRFPGAVERGPSYGNRRYDNRSYDSRSYGYRAYGYQSYGYRPGRRSYVLPFGYRPHGYRPGWSLSLYFGRPYAAYGYPYGDPSPYGYYSPIPGRLYGSVRIVDAPRDASVFVDGYYAGVVDDYDGVFQHLNLEAGPHHIEVELDGYPPVVFDVQVVPGQTITYRANIF